MGNGPIHLLSAVPYPLGFHLTETLVLIGQTHGVLVVTARLDQADASPGADHGFHDRGDGPRREHRHGSASFRYCCADGLGRVDVELAPAG